jgi:hypothetical protein
MFGRPRHRKRFVAACAATAAAKPSKIDAIIWLGQCPPNTTLAAAPKIIRNAATPLSKAVSQRLARSISTTPKTAPKTNPNVDGRPLELRALATSTPSAIGRGAKISARKALSMSQPNPKPSGTANAPRKPTANHASHAPKIIVAITNGGFAVSVNHSAHCGEAPKADCRARVTATSPGNGPSTARQAAPKTRANRVRVTALRTAYMAHLSAWRNEWSRKVPT